MSPTRHAPLFVLVFAAGCQGGLGAGAPLGRSAPGDDAGTSVPSDDSDDAGADARPRPPGPVGRVERCANAVDDDADGEIDEGCVCEPGTERRCYLGPPGVRGVGACAEGTQRCDQAGLEFHSWGACTGSVLPAREILHNGVDDDCDGARDEPDGVCVPQADERDALCGNGYDDDCDGFEDCADPACVGTDACPMPCQDRELHCHGGRDDDCDGAVDCDDAECVGDPVCDPGPCPPGQTPTYRPRELAATAGPSSIRDGDGGPRMPMSCERGRCDPGLVAVQYDDVFTCVPPPPPCPDGQHPQYQGGWGCEPGCELVVHYGAIYGGQNVCADRPDLECPPGQVPTFVYETQRWSCRPTCDNGLYDRQIVDGRLVCVPC